MNKLPFIEKAVSITTTENPLNESPCQVYRVARVSGLGPITLRDGDSSGPIRFKDWIGISGSVANPGVDFNPVGLEFKTGVFVEGLSSGEIVLYLGPGE